SIDASLDSRAGTVAITHDPLRDQLNLNAPLPVTAGMAIRQAGIPLTLDASSTRLFWRHGTSGAFSRVPMSPAGADSFTASIPSASGYTGTVQYYLYAASDSAGIDAFDPPGGASAPHAFSVGPDGIAPLVVVHPITGRSPEQLPAT